MIKVTMVAIAVCLATSAGFAGSCCAAKKAEAAKAGCAPGDAAKSGPSNAASDTASTSTVVVKK